MANKRISVGGYTYEIEMLPDGGYGNVELVGTDTFNVMMDSDRDIDLFAEEKDYGIEPIGGIKKIADDVNKFFHKENFYKRFPIYGNVEEDGTVFLNRNSYVDDDGNELFFELGEPELDALQHFYGQMLAQDKYGTVLASTAGLYNEIKGSIWKGNKWKGQKIDIMNNASGRENSDPSYLRNLKSLIAENPVSNDAVHNLITYGLRNTITPPLTEQHDFSLSKIINRKK